MSGPSFAARVLDWHDREGRKDLPWQQDPTPYRVWVSEIMLQQTQVATVIPYYRHFTDSFPTVRRLADAAVDEVLAHWAGLGYYARARNLHRAASIVRDEHAGVLPSSFDALAALPGIGRSTAGAILALSQGRRHAILDGNVKRVLARYHVIGGWPGRSAVARALWERAEGHLPRTRVAAYTQGLMDLGATLCTRAAPACERCPLAGGCAASRAGRQADFPGRKPPAAKPLRQTCMVLAWHAGALYLEKRPPAGVWGGLWSLPELGDRDELPAWCAERLAASPASCDEWPALRHSFSHFDLDIRPLIVRLDRASAMVADDGGRWMPLAGATEPGLAAPVRRLIDSLRERVAAS